MVKGLIERDRLRETFGRYVTRQVADHCSRTRTDSEASSCRSRCCSRTFARSRASRRRCRPRQLLDFLNVYFSGMVESVMAHDGVVDKFIGDAIMAVFGAPSLAPTIRSMR